MQNGRLEQPSILQICRQAFLVLHWPVSSSAYSCVYIIIFYTTYGLLEQVKRVCRVAC